MRFNVLLHHFVSYIARARRKIPARPQMSPPELSSQLTKLFQHPPTTASFDSLHQLAYRHFRRHRHQQVHMVRRHMSTEDVHIHARTRLSHQFSQTNPYFTAQHRLPVFCDPHQVVFQIVHSVRCFSVAHCCIVQPPSSLSTHSVGVKTACLKGRGFNPIYRQ